MRRLLLALLCLALPALAGATVTTTHAHVDVVSTGATMDDVAITFEFFTSDHIQVVSIDGSDVETSLIEGLDYEVTEPTGDLPSTSTLDILVPVTVGETIRISRVVPVEQVVNLLTAGRYDPNSIERGMDLLTMMIQQIEEGTVPAGEFEHGNLGGGALHAEVIRGDQNVDDSGTCGFMCGDIYDEILDHVRDDDGTAHGITTATLNTEDVFNVKHYGAVGNGVTDDSVAVLAAITAAMGEDATGDGGTIYFPPGVYKITSQIAFPYDDPGSPGVAPSQPNVRLVGAGAEFSGQNRVPRGGSFLDLRYDGSPAKIDTRGLGMMEITGLTIGQLGGTDDTPFLQSTNTTLLIHDAAFYGATASPGTTQDAIILGGNTQEATDATEESAFQGYGTDIHDTYFQNIQRALWCRTWCNGIIFRHNEIWQGSGFTTGAAIDIDSNSPTGQAIGNLIEGNLVECQGYKWAIRVGYGQANTIAFNNLYDPGASMTAFYRMESGALNNQIFDGFHETTKPTLSEVETTDPTTMVITGLTGENLKIGHHATRMELSAIDVVQTGSNIVSGHVEHSNGSEFYSQMSGTAANPDHVFYLKPDGGTADAYVAHHYYGTGSASVRAQIFENPDGDVRVKGQANGVVYLGDFNGQHLYWHEGSLNLVLNDATGRVSFGGTSASFVALKGTGTTLAVIKANEGGDGNLTAAGITASGALAHTGSTLGFYSATPATKPTVTGNVQTGSAEDDLLAEMATLGLITDSSTAVPSIQAAAVVATTPNPSATQTCDSITRGTLLYVDDSDDTAVSYLCFCGTAADDSTYGWRKADGGAACP